MSRQLKSMEEKKLYVDLFVGECDTETIVCQIREISELFVCVTVFNHEGEYEGVCVLPLSTIMRVRTGTSELKQHEKLIRMKGGIPDLPRFDIESLQSAVVSIHGYFKYVDVEIYLDGESMCFIGEVVEMDDEFLVMKEYGSMQRLERSMLLFRTDSIMRISADGRYDRDILYLHSTLEP